MEKRKKYIYYIINTWRYQAGMYGLLEWPSARELSLQSGLIVTFFIAIVVSSRRMSSLKNPIVDLPQQTDIIL